MAGIMKRKNSDGINTVPKNVFIGRWIKHRCCFAKIVESQFFVALMLFLFIIIALVLALL
ncbi:hypothetical protein COX74_03555 [bacterium (Candidatus Gribaldobacteria) CG_4_10_14_0_2_um_filter_41_16]|uniref:Uncharacterized protein n=4 Tax=Candidatus Gribaldobacteria TaxID=2798536 RepID=A0A2M7VHI6_9BACT|nr:MAG: hypothetical protein COU03_03630 [bacterium (Candidatus Gribaldobacteria) CG10_big_fil_rev_8_21_14_0_10_41_12]PIV47385.1 MAG: hypothetical protein COS21_00265 [bacterium (Candidatus Gribaldobacteria) CG02_land_8_20_14_3_00_41_15]PIX03485.1 MAG: hypothetical protein COZ78_00045 [bacterium (Candidatus Gribaldobacteria) CG_4_8_14_3_um_filter_42_11]PJA01187.1 MAG: hypothetical protein COX74_03555 [bacterium (Candidatus Gribaldobacteria) CG_4_10_14_0_2_um_filter_41_16]